MSDIGERKVDAADRVHLVERLLTRLGERHQEAREQWKALKTSLATTPAPHSPEWGRMERAFQTILEEQDRLACTLAAIPEGIEEFAEDFLSHYSPQNIDKAARMERKRFGLKSAARWKKYEELAGDWTRKSLAEKIELRVFEVAQRNAQKPATSQGDHL